MDAVIGLVLVILAALGIGAWVIMKDNHSFEKGHRPSPLNQNLFVGKPSRLRRLPMAFYIAGWLTAVAVMIAAVNTLNGTVLFIGFVCVILCFGTGRVIELLQIIADELQQKRMSE